jgi:NAD(P)-dependent dehydrogenase (short-subunit alcohol dehydrogenase family)
VVAEIQALGQKAAAVSLDISNTSNFDTFIIEFQGVLKTAFCADSFDALINNAGVGHYSAYTETTEADFDKMVNIHLKAPYFLTQKLLPLMNDGGSILNTSSGLARFSYLVLRRMPS